jgi:hypothetical protein
MTGFPASPCVIIRSGGEDMRLQDHILHDFQSRTISKKHKDALRIVIGELQREKHKELSDEQVVKILRKLAGYEKELGEKRDQEYLDVLESYLPREATREEIAAWIDQNIDFSRYKQPMQAMRDILAHFGARADGNTVKDILSKRFST